MKIVMFGDQDTVNLFHIVGIEGIIHEKEDTNFLEKFEAITSDPEVGILIISEELMIKHQKIVFPYKLL